MNHERLLLQGRLLEKRKEAKEMSDKADGLVTSIRMVVNPYDNLKKMDIEKAYHQMSELHEMKIRHTECLKEIEKLEEALGNG